MKINGTPMPMPGLSFTVYKVKLKDGPLKDWETLAGNTTVVFVMKHRYELNADGDFVYSPQGQN